MSKRDEADVRLATYGTLAPGRPNVHLLADLDGPWSQGIVHGTLVEKGWGADMGFPAIVLEDSAAAVAVHVFASSELPAQWALLDAFEGTGYRREPVRVFTQDGEIWAGIYVLAH